MTLHQQILTSAATTDQSEVFRLRALFCEREARQSRDWTSKQDWEVSAIECHMMAYLAARTNGEAMSTRFGATAYLHTTKAPCRTRRKIKHSRPHGQRGLVVSANLKGRMVPPPSRPRPDDAAKADSRALSTAMNRLNNLDYMKAETPFPLGIRFGLGDATPEDRRASRQATRNAARPHYEDGGLWGVLQILLHHRHHRRHRLCFHSAPPGRRCPRSASCHRVRRRRCSISAGRAPLPRRL
jgi:hypothetical protein